MSRHLREQIDSALPTDPDLDAFMQSRFKDVYRRISRGMDRVQKITLLLDLHAESEVSGHLEEWTSPLLQTHRQVQHLPTPSKTSNSVKCIAAAIGVCTIMSIGITFLFGPAITRHAAFSAFSRSPRTDIESIAWAKTAPRPSNERLVPDSPGGAIYDDNGEPVNGAKLVLVGTNCTTTSDNTGAFDFDKCSKDVMLALKRSRINIYRQGMPTIQNVELYLPPTRTVINIIKGRILRNEAINTSDQRVEVCPGGY